MTNSANQRFADLAVPGDALTLQLLADLDEAYRIQAPALSMPQTDGVAVERPYRPWRLDLRRPVWALAAALAAVAVVLAATLPGTNTTEVSAADILDRAAAVSAPGGALESASSYHINATWTTTTGGATTVETTETWFKDPQHVRIERKNGSRVVHGSSKDGDDFWMYKTAPDGQLLVARVKAGNLAGIPANVLGTSLPQVMSVYNRSCQTATSMGEETVAGRKAHVISTTSNYDNCKDFTFQLPAGVTLPKSTTLQWIDKETFFTLKTQTEQAGVRTVYEVKSVDLGTQTLPASFAYQAPAGVKVTEAASMEELLRLPGWNDMLSLPPTSSMPSTLPAATPGQLQPFTAPVNVTPITPGTTSGSPFQIVPAPSR